MNSSSGSISNNISNINSKVTKLFNNPNINFFIIMMLILIISCYTLINTNLKYAISSFVANPIIILFVLISVILIGYYNINIAVLVLLLLFIALYGTTIFNSKTKTTNMNMNMNNGLEGFTDDTDIDTDIDTNNDEDSLENFPDDETDNESDDEHELENTFPKITKSAYKQKEEDDAKTDETVDKIKNTILGTMNNFKKVSDNEYQKSLNENKQIQYLNEKKQNMKSNKNKNSKQNFTNTNSKGNSKKENFQTIKTRKFDPNKEEDTNFLITKEVLQDMITRIDYNYESSKYLKKYLKHRVEEIVELNKLLEDND